MAVKILLKLILVVLITSTFTVKSPSCFYPNLTWLSYGDGSLIFGNFSTDRLGVPSPAILHSVNASIVANPGSIVANPGSIVANPGSIVTNSSSIVTNSSSIVTNSSSIVTNSSSIVTNSSSIVTNSSSIVANFSSIVNDSSEILINSTLLLNNSTSALNNSSSFEDKIAKVQPAATDMILWPEENFRPMAEYNSSEIDKLVRGAKFKNGVNSPSKLFEALEENDSVTIVADVTDSCKSSNYSSYMGTLDSSYEVDSTSFYDWMTILVHFNKFKKRVMLNIHSDLAAKEVIEILKEDLFKKKLPKKRYQIIINANVFSAIARRRKSLQNIHAKLVKKQSLRKLAKLPFKIIFVLGWYSELLDEQDFETHGYTWYDVMLASKLFNQNATLGRPFYFSVRAVFCHSKSLEPLVWLLAKHDDANMFLWANKEREKERATHNINVLVRTVKAGHFAYYVPASFLDSISHNFSSPKCHYLYKPRFCINQPISFSSRMPPIVLNSGDSTLTSIPNFLGSRYYVFTGYVEFVNANESAWYNALYFFSYEWKNTTEQPIFELSFPHPSIQGTHLNVLYDIEPLSKYVGTCPVVGHAAYKFRVFFDRIRKEVVVSLLKVVRSKRGKFAQEDEYVSPVHVRFRVSNNFGPFTDSFFEFRAHQATLIWYDLTGERFNDEKGSF